MSENELSPKQQTAIEVLVTSGNVTEAAQLTGVSRETIYSWMRNNVAFTNAMDRFSSLALSDLSTRLTNLGQRAVDTLESIMSNPETPLKDRIRVAEIFLSKLIQLAGISNFDRRLTLLEGTQDEFKKAAYEIRKRKTGISISS